MGGARVRSAATTAGSRCSGRAASVLRARRRAAARDGEPPSGPRHEAIRDALARRGAASTARSSPRPGGGRDREVLDALWDLVWAGEVTNDTFTPLRALRWRAPGRATPAPAAGAADVARPARGGRSLVPGRRSRRPSDEPAPAPTERLHALALALLERHGVLTREAVAPRASTAASPRSTRSCGPWRKPGRIRRGYFVEGLGAAQFALPGAVDRLRARARTPSRGGDGSSRARGDRSRQPVRRRLPWPRRGDDDRRPLQRAAGAYVVLIDGAAAVYLERGGGSIQTLPAADDPEVAARALHALGTLVAEGRVRELVISRVDGRPVGESPLREAMRDAGFSPGLPGPRAAV